MSKTTQENKAKKAKLAVEEKEKVVKATSSRLETEPSVNPDSSAQPAVTPEVAAADSQEPQSPAESKTRKTRVRSKRYQAARKNVDINKLYPLAQAVDLVKLTTLTKFDGKVEAHLIVTEEGQLGEITFPHLDLGAKKIVVLNDAVLAEIKDGKINFDILIATPVTMPKLLPFARLLGPRGLMPNPKNGTLTDKPDEAIKKLSVAKTALKTEKKAKVVHIIVGKVSQPAPELIANVTELVRVIRPQRLKKLVLCSTMGPGVKVAFEK